jgi:hypothetical protein
VAVGTPAAAMGAACCWLPVLAMHTMLRQHCCRCAAAAGLPP